MENKKIPADLDLGRLKRTVFLRFGMAGPLLAAMLFIPAGTLGYWQAWVYLAILLVPMNLVLAYLLKNDPQLLARRMRTKEKEKKQQAIILLSYPVFIAAFLLPGFDRRCGWSSVPLWLVLVAEFIVLAGYLLFVRVMKENRFLSRIVEVDRDQKVIDTGPYAVVRHPMYAGILPLYLFSPLALGSYWSLIPAAPLVLVIVARILNEEKVLVRDLPGYAEYRRRVKYRLVPGIW
ncbi:MAG TPA: isoprenylcysteine carboxylmethyltransferase family protein [Candidatus Binatia bacterium]|nr:isoprenylcysteine carboxylmethyltransferase family protein [Candidatus Binatia bacterium]